MNPTQGHVLETVSAMPIPALMRGGRGNVLAALTYNPPAALLRRYATENKSDLVTANKAFRALKQFLAVCATAEHPCSPSIAIDAMWHEFLMFSEEYYSFCLQYFGAVIHHHPTEMMMNGNYRETRESASRLFGELDARFWPKKTGAGALCSGGDCSANCGDSGG